MQVVAIIQARMGSTRFPGKSMYELAGKPSLGHLLDSIRQILPLDSIHIATSINEEDNSIAQYSDQYGVKVFRGHQTNVASRFFEILNNNSYSHFIRLNGDSPLLDHRIIEKALRLSSENKDAIISSSINDSAPSGMNVELLPSKTFTESYREFSTEEDFEHVTNFFYQRPTEFNVIALPKLVYHPTAYHFSFDTKDDLTRIDKLFSHFDKPHYRYNLQEKCRIYDLLFGN